MSSRVSLWLTDEETQLLKQKAEELGMRHFELAILVVGKFLGAKVEPTPKARRKWLDKHEKKTRAEFKEMGSGTERRLKLILGEATRPLTTKQLQGALGWAKSGNLSEILRDCPEFEEVEAPIDAPRSRGRQPKWWMLAVKKPD